MFKYRFNCTDKEAILCKIKQLSANNSTYIKSIFGIRLYESGIHIKSCEDKIEGFFLQESEEESHKGSPIRVCFTGKFTEINGDLFFEAYLYPRIIEVLFLLFAAVFLSVTGKTAGLVISIILLSFFAKGYYDMIKSLYDELCKIFC